MADELLSESKIDEAVNVLENWKRRCQVSMRCYNAATDSAARRERLIGVPATLLSAIVATAVFVTVSQDPAVEWKIATGVIALGSAGLTGLQTFLRLAERVEQYREAARRYGRLRRRIEQTLLLMPASRQQLDEVLSELSESLDSAASGSPNAPRLAYLRADLEVRGRIKTSGLDGVRLWLSDLSAVTVRSRVARRDD